ncbi:MAG: PBP1A family penicillin-binding protein [Sphingomonadales bacterium]
MAKAPSKRSTPKKRKTKKVKRPLRQRLVRIISTVFSVALLGAVFFSGVLFWLSRDLPDVDILAQPPGKPPIEVLANDGSLLARYGRVRGEVLPFYEIPPQMVQAIVAIEDRRFFDHGGIDVYGILRAAFANVKAGRLVQGGSTITQQLAKNLFLTPERTFTRKAREALLALALEREYEKEQILSLYLNRVYLGGGAYGIDAAAKLYFNKSARDLDYGEAAVLAGLVKAPSRLAPTTDPQAALDRGSVVLAAMVEAGYLNQEQAQAITDIPIAFQSHENGSRARYFTDWVVSEVARDGGAQVIESTLDIKAQTIAENVITSHLAGPSNEGLEAAIIAIRPDGSIAAMVGGRDYSKTVFNRATQALRQPGSAFKLFVYLTALEAGLDPASTMRDSPIRFEGWAPRNHWGSFSRENISLNDALAKSYNSIAVKVSERVGRNNVIAMAKRLGVTSDITPHPSVALGTSEMTLLELTQAYAALARGGNLVRVYGNKARKGSGAPVLDPAVAAQMTKMLERVITTGTGKQANPGRPAAGKTGTSQDGRDGWFIGFTADMVVGVWVGRDDGTAVKGLSGGRLPARIWADYVRQASAGLPVQPLTFGQTDERGLFDRLFNRN